MVPMIVVCAASICRAMGVANLYAGANRRNHADMKIGIELLQIEEGASGGIVPLLQGVLAALFRNRPEHEFTLFCTPKSPKLFEGAPHAIYTWDLPPSWCFELLDVHAKCLGLDVLIRSYPHDAAMCYPHAQQIVLMPDLQHEFFPEFFVPEMLQWRRESFQYWLENAGAIATLTQHSRHTILQHAAGREPDVFLMPPALRTGGESATVFDLQAQERSLLPPGDFFLYPANLWPHKNHRRILEAFRLFLNSVQRPFEFIFTGHPEGWPSLANDFADLPIRHMGFIRPQLLQVLLCRAKALLFFSLFEGFGMPLLEAFAAGTPVGCSNTSSLPEVGGDAVLMCDPTDPRAMSEVMERIVSDIALRSRLIESGKKRWRRYSWDASAAALFQACTRVGGRALSTHESASAVPQGVYHQLKRAHEQITHHERTLEKMRKAHEVMQAIINRLETQLRNQLFRRLLRPVKHAVLRIMGKNERTEAA